MTGIIWSKWESRKGIFKKQGRIMIGSSKGSKGPEHWLSIEKINTPNCAFKSRHAGAGSGGWLWIPVSKANSATLDCSFNHWAVFLTPSSPLMLLFKKPTPKHLPGLHWLHGYYEEQLDFQWHRTEGTLQRNKKTELEAIKYQQFQKLGKEKLIGQEEWCGEIKVLKIYDELGILGSFRCSEEKKENGMVLIKDSTEGQRRCTAQNLPFDSGWESQDDLLGLILGVPVLCCLLLLELCWVAILFQVWEFLLCSCWRRHGVGQSDDLVLTVLAPSWNLLEKALKPRKKQVIDF